MISDRQIGCSGTQVLLIFLPRLRSMSRTTRRKSSSKTKGKRSEQPPLGGDFRPVRPEDDKRSASDDQQVTKRSAESVPPEPRGLRGRGGERPFSKSESARSAGNWRERGSENESRRLSMQQMRLNPRKPRKYASRFFGAGERTLAF